MNEIVTILSFSARKNGNCAKIAKYISNQYMQTNVSIYTIDSEIIPPCGKCDYECLKTDKLCPQLTVQQTKIMDAICKSSLVYFVVPNYCGYPCANYFAFNERSVGYFNMNSARMEAYMSVPKRFIIVSNAEGFEDAMAQQANGIPEILYLKSKTYEKESIAGDLLDSKDAIADLDAFLHHRRH